MRINFAKPIDTVDRVKLLVSSWNSYNCDLYTWLLPDGEELRLLYLETLMFANFSSAEYEIDKLTLDTK